MEIYNYETPDCAYTFFAAWAAISAPQRDRNGDLVRVVNEDGRSVIIDCPTISTAEFHNCGCRRKYDSEHTITAAAPVATGEDWRDVIGA